MMPPARQPMKALSFHDLGKDQSRGLSIAGGRLSQVSEAACLRQALVTLLSTRPGERVMQPDWGCDLDALAFAPMSPSTAMLARLIVERAITRFEPRIRIVEITVTSDAEILSALNLNLSWRAVRGLATGELALQVPLDAQNLGETPQ